MSEAKKPGPFTVASVAEVLLAVKAGTAAQELADTLDAALAAQEEK